MGPTE
jgi:hypothetical protein